MEMIVSAISQGIIWGIMGIGLYISFRILRMADLTIESSFVVGAATTATAVTNFGLSPYLAMIISFFAGMATGAITGLMITKLKINPLLAGIITLTGMYSVNLKLMGQANLGMNSYPTFKDLFTNWNMPRNFDTILFGVLVAAIVIFILAYFFKTEIGQALIATGDNEKMARSLGIETNEMVMLGLMLANGIVALSGALVSQDNGYADVNMGTGTVVVAFAAVVIAEVVFTNISLPLRLVSILFGSIIYRFLIMIVLMLNFNPDDFKLLSAVILALVLAYPHLSNSDILKKLRYQRRSFK